MKERPILFSAAMVRAILEGRKTQTRRIFKYKGMPDDPDFQPHHICKDSGGDWVAWCGKNPEGFDWKEFTERQYPNGGGMKCPYGKPGNRLWVRETFAEICHSEDGVCGGPECLDDVFEYRADKPDAKWAGDWPNEFRGSEVPNEAKWKPSIFMPRAASRITLEVVSVRVERLQEISREDAIAEGVKWGECPLITTQADLQHNLHPGTFSLSQTVDYVGGYRSLWTSINGPDSWGANPWVWVVEFKRVEL